MWLPVALSLASFAGKEFATSKATEARQKELEERMDEERAAESKRSINRLDRLHSIISSNVATAAAHGVSPGSSTFKAINEEVFNKFDEDENADVLNLQYKANYINQMETLNKNEDYVSAFGDIASLGEDYWRAMGGKR